MTQLDNFGIVIIGRNEGERLRGCLKSAFNGSAPVVYVDSGSSDGSVQLARSFGAEIVELDAKTPYTAARARNAGLEWLIRRCPELKYVQFIDGDCEVAEDWYEQGLKALRANPDVAVVFGHLREKFPNLSVYNRLCHLEWRWPLGEVDASGGIAMMKVEAVRQVGGFNMNLAGPEDTELCARLRMRGWKIWHVEAEMAQHDAAMTRLSQWWTRNVRTGQAYAHVSKIYRTSAIRLFVRQSRSTWIWGLILPIAVMVLLWPTRGLALGLLIAYPILGYRIYRRERRDGTDRYDAVIYSLSCVFGKFPQMQGQVKFHLNRLRGRQPIWINHKESAPPSAAK